MKRNRKIIANSFILYLRLALTTLIGLFSSRIILNNLGAKDYGLFSVVGGIILMMNFLNTSMLSTSFRFIAFEIGKGKSGNPNRIFNISLAIHIFLALLFLISAELIGVYYIKNFLNIEHAKIQDAVFIFRVAIFSTIFSVVGVPFQGVITAHEKFSISAFIELFRTLLKLGVAVALIFYSGNKLRFFASLMLFVSFLPTTLIISYCIHFYKQIIKWKFHKILKDYIEILKYSGWIMLGAGASISQNQGAALMINFFYGTVMNAAYGISNQLNNYIFMFSKNLSQAAVPQITKSYSGGDPNRTIQLVNLSSKYSFFLMLMPAVPIILYIDLILELWLVDVPQYTSAFTVLMITNGLIISLGSGFDAAIQATGKIKKYQLFYSFLSIIMLPIAYGFYLNGFPPYSINALFILGSIVAFVGQLFTLQSLTTFKIHTYFKETIIRVFLVIFFMCPLFMSRQLFSDSISGLLLFSILGFIFMILDILFVGLTAKERHYFNDLLKSIFLKVKKRFQ